MGKKVICPECKEDVTEQSVIGHAVSHWGGEPERIKYPEAWERFKELYEAAKERGEVT